MLVKSMYTIPFCANGKYYLYSSRSNFFSEITEDLYKCLESDEYDSLPEDAIDELLKRELILEGKDLYTYYYSKYLGFNAVNNNLTTLNLVIAPTTGCNFDCPYCFESKNTPKTITSEVIDSLVKFVKEHEHAKEVSITWYGGEPLIAFDKIEEIYNRLSEDGMPKITSQSFITNGYCIDGRVIDFLKKNGCSKIQITLDGINEKHDVTRRLKNSTNPTFGRIIDNIRNLLSELPEIRIDIRVNVNKKNYKNYVDVNSFFKKEFPDNKNISVYPGIIREDSDDHLGLCESSFSPSELIDLYELLEREGVKMPKFPKRKYRGCMMYQMSSYIIGPEGEIYKCWNDVSNPDKVIGYINDKKITNKTLMVNYALRSIPFNDECKHCHAFPICDGGCGYNRYRNSFEGCHFDTCSPYKDVEKLKNALLTSKYFLNA
ncbi:MAG: radical SAM protein [Muribaculaceae bacterium]|nr:radical SAM protein [Muribaculaceae bacterium]